MNKSEGFTLIEILVAITIIAILSTIGILAYSGIQKDARDQKRLSSLKLVEQSLEYLRSKNGFYPVGSDVKPQDITQILALMVDVPTDPILTRTFKYSAFPPGCNNTTFKCIDYVLCGVKEGTKVISEPPECTALNCSNDSTSISCQLGLSAQ